MEESPSSTIWDGRITGIRFGLATRHEICTSSISDFPISHASQLANPFLGLPLESGKCEACGAAEPGSCEGHFGFIELPIPIYHPSHVSELKRLLSLLCLKCLKMKNTKLQIKNVGILEKTLSSCCEETSQISVNEVKTADGSCFLELKLPSRSRLKDGFWNFLEKYGYRYGDNVCRSLLPSEVMAILKKMPESTKKKLSLKGYFPQEGYILQYIPVPPNCLSVPDISDGITVMSSDLSSSMLKKVLKQIETIKSSRSGTPNFESHEVEANDLQSIVAQYLQIRGTSKASRDIDSRLGTKELNDSSTKAWLEKMKTLFVRKGSGSSSRSVITGDSYKGVNEIGLPSEIAQKMTFEERVTQHNMQYLQKLVDEKLCLTYRDGSSTYSLKEGSKGHTFLRVGQVVHRRIMDGDTVFINRPPTTHKHSLQALSVYIHDDHTVKINPLICGPLSADFDGDCVHLFYPQSLAAKAEVLELFAVEKQLLSSHSGNLNLQLATDSMLSLKLLLKNYFLSEGAAQQLAMFLSKSLPEPALVKAHRSGSRWTALQILQTALPESFNCTGDKHQICNSEILYTKMSRDVIQPIISDIVTSIFFEKGPDEVLKFFNSLQPLLMESLFAEGFSVGLEDFSIPTEVMENIQSRIQDISKLLRHLRSSYDELVQLQVENHLRLLKEPISNFIQMSTAMGNVIDLRSESALTKVVQQVGFLGLQLADRGKFYSTSLVSDMASLFKNKYPFTAVYPAEEFGLVRSCLFHGLDPYQEMVHSISAREVIVRSSRGLTEPGTLFKNLMAILRDVVICYDGTVRNVCSNSVIQFEYGAVSGTKSFFPAGEPVGVLAATAMSNPAYKAVLDSSPSSNSSWEMMKEILLSTVTFKNDLSDRRVILYLNDCNCKRKYCREKAAYLVKNHLRKVSLKDIAKEFLTEYNEQQAFCGSADVEANLLGHIHLNKEEFQKLNLSMQEVSENCQQTIDSFRKKKKVGHLFKRIKLSASEACSFGQSCGGMPCLKFWQDTNDHHLERTSHVFADSVCPVLLETIVKGDPRVCMADIIWIGHDMTTWIRNPGKSQKGELAVNVVLEKDAVKQSGDTWRIVMDSCLPVLHLIDTCRSIPRAIKQVQELLGISCAFEQAVQRLSTSVSMVAKGVLKEHLILLANSMTCAGNLIGFNSGGIKALSRSLNVQVPFTEATLFTPKKCFERAAEKGHLDSLSSIVASCSWGKHVAVGTGSKFDVLWDTREVGPVQQDGIDVYNFLHLVSSSLNEEGMSSACLGAETDHLELETDSLEWGLSPEHSSDKPTFEDSTDFQDDFNNQMVGGSMPSESNWEKEKASCLNSESAAMGWAVDKRQNRASASNSSDWSSWGAGKVQSEDAPPVKGQETDESPQKWVSGASVSKSNDWSSWGAAKVQKEDTRSSWGADNLSVRAQWVSGDSVSNSEDAPSVRGQETDDSPQKWVSRASVPKSSDQSSWGAVKVQKEDTRSSWGAGKAQKEETLSERAHERDENWVSRAPVSKSSGWSSWGAGKVQKDDTITGTAQDTDEVPQTKTSVAWGANNNLRTEKSSQNNDSNGGKQWGTNKKQEFGAGTSKSSGWSNWGANALQGEKCDQIKHSNGEKQWGTPQDIEQAAPSPSTNGWGSADVGSGSGHGQPQWGQARRFSAKREQTGSPRTWGPSNTGDWRNRPSANFTATRQRLDMFPSEEQEILLEVEPIMQSIRRIFQQTGYNDGDPLSADDQTYVVDNVFNYHPEKAAKMGAGIDYVMISKHSSFQDTRCLYVVCTDGRREDFSYRKCLENFIRGKYPLEKADSFIEKYFKRPQPRPPNNNNNREQQQQQRQQRPEEEGAPLSSSSRQQ